ncbi:MAG: DUF3857 domain-containing transglutaminase family protein [Cyclonatronaceae bacterium]
MLESESLTDDPDARAVILFDKGRVYFNAPGNVVMERHIRVKILDPDASGYTNISIRHNPKKRAYRLNDLQAQTLNAGEDGSIQTEPLGNDDFFEQRDEGDWRTTRFTFSDVRAGSVIEYSYEIEKTNLLALYPWYFQHKEPVLFSQLEVYMPEIYSYSTHMTGNSAEVEITEEPYPANEFRSPFAGMQRTYTATNMPAIRDEPFMTTVNDHRTRIRFQLYEMLTRMSGSGAYRSGFDDNWQGVLQDWDEVRVELSLHSDFGRQIGRTSRDIRNKTEELTEGLDTTFDKARAIYEYVSSGIVWDGNRGLLATKGIRDAFKDKTGTGPDITLLFIGMLREAGIDAYPVILSTRSFGKINPDWPILSQYNHVVAYIQDGEGGFLAEPLSPYLPFGMLLPQSLNYTGNIIDREVQGWIDLNPTSSDINQSVALMTLDEQGGLSGQVQVKMDGYQALTNRQRLDRQEDSESEFVRNRLLADFPVNELIDYEIQQKDDRNTPLVTNLEVEKSEHAMVAGDMMYLNPFLLNTWTENPLTLENRSFPVQFNYGMDHHYTLNLTLPEGYVVEDVPESTAITLSENMTYHQMVQPMGNTVQVVTRLQVNELEIQPENYAYLQDFFGQIVSLQASQIVLSKASAQPPTEVSNDGE